VLDEADCPPSSLLDYQFGWRWLLPIMSGDNVLLLGFTKFEKAFWGQVFENVFITEDATKATILLVNDLSPDCIVDSDLVQLRCFCVIGSGKIVAKWRKRFGDRFPEISNYALLPPHNTRVVIPMNRTDWILQGLELHRPGRWIARLGVTVLKGLTYIGINFPLRTRMLCIASSTAGILPWGAFRAGSELVSSDIHQNFILYLGVSDESRKTVILPLGSKQCLLLKQGELPKAKAALYNEADALRAMSQTPIANQVPLLLKLVERNGVVTLYQEYRPRRYATKARIDKATVNFLIMLTQQGGYTRSLTDVLAHSEILTANEAHAAGQIAYARVRSYLDILAIKGMRIWGHRNHGDFAPWNCSWTSEGFFVFDWEMSQSWHIAFSDAFYFVIAPELYINKKPEPIRAIKMAIELATLVADGAGYTAEKIKVFFALWVLIVCKKHDFYQDILNELEFEEKNDAM